MLASSYVALVLLSLMLPLAAHAQDASGISSPAPGAVISGDVPILGSALIDPFQKYELHYKQEPSSNDAFIYFAGGTAPVANGQLGVWQAGGLPPGTYSLRLRVVKVDGNYAEYFTPNLTVNQGAAVPQPSPTPAESPTPTATFTPAPQPTPVIGQVTQPQVEGEEATPTPAAAAAVEVPPTPAPEGGLPTATPLVQDAAAAGEVVESDALSRQLGEALGFERLRTQFFNGMRISAAIFIGFAALLAGKRLFEYMWRRYG